MIKKIIGIFVCMLLIVTAVIPITGYVLEKKISKNGYDRGTIYVDDDADPSWYDATHVKTIQEGINNASTGDMVFVYNGTYEENVKINKTIDLIGEDKDFTIIQGFDESDNAVFITADLCNVSEFTVKKGGTDSAGIKVEASHCSIHDTIFFDNQDKGLWLVNSENNIILDNTLFDNSHGISVKNSNNNTISNNNASNNKYYGIIFVKSNNNNIFGNTVNSNEAIGIYLNLDCDNNNISTNTVTSNEERGIRLYMSDDNIIFNNIVSDNSAPSYDGAIVCYYSNNNDIFSNTVNSNANQGIYLENSDDNMIIKNILFKNSNYGINCMGSSNNIIYHNNFINNTQNAIDDNTNTWNNSMLQEGNYWDDYTGEDSDGNGIGDTPYDILGGDNQDIYPLMSAYGPPKADFTYIIDGKNVSFNASRSYDYDGTIISYEWDFGDNTNGMGLIVNHTYLDDGIYNVTLTVTDNDNKNDSTIKTISVDSIKPEIIDHTPSIGYTGDSFTFNATVTDNIEVDKVIAAYRYENGDQKNVNMSNTVGDYWEGTIIIEDTLDPIFYRIFAWDTSNNQNTTDAKNVTIYDNDPPEITNVSANPKIQMIDEYVNISADVTDNINVSEVYLYIVYPDSTVKNFSITQNKIGDTYYSNSTYSQEGVYTFHIWANDTSDVANISEDYTFEMVMGAPPEIPQIQGPTHGTVGIEYPYIFSSTDPDGHDVYYYVDWGDETNTGWIGPFASGDPQQENHSWDTKGTFIVKVKAKDEKGLESGWAELEVTIPRNKQSVQQSSLRSKSISQTIQAVRATKIKNR